MSGAAIGYVYEFSPFKGATFSVHLAIGDVVNDAHGWEFYMSVVNLSKKARVNRKTAGLALDALESAGFLECLETGDPVKLRTLGRSLKYRFLRPAVVVVFDGGVRRDTAPSRDQGVRRDTAPGEASDRGGVRRDTARTKERTEVERNPSSKPRRHSSTDDDQGTLISISDRPPDPARQVLAEVWEAKKAAGLPTPGNYVAALGVVKKLLAAGWSTDQVRDGCVAAPTISTGAVEIVLNRAKALGATVIRPARPTGPGDQWQGLPVNLRPGPGKSRKLTGDEVRASP